MNDVRHDMPSPPLESTHGRTSSGVACHHRLWAAHTVERRWAWHDITAFGQHTRSNDVERDMPTPPLVSPHGRTTSSMAFHYRLWAAHTVELRRAWHAIIAFGKHKQITTSGVACQHHFWAAQTVKRHRVWNACIAFGQHMVERRRAWHDITYFG